MGTDICGDQTFAVYIDPERCLRVPRRVPREGFGRFRFFAGMEEIKPPSPLTPQCPEGAVGPNATQLRNPGHHEPFETALERLYTQGEVAKHFGVTTRTVENWRASGLLPFVRLRGIIRIKERDLAILIERRRVDGRGCADR